MSIEQDDLELLINRVEAMRAAQRQYFRQRSEVDKKKSITLEETVDAILRQMRRKGYNPDRFNSRSEQTKLL